MRDLPAARWVADPYGRHELRYWDGVAWTAHVSDGGVTSHDLVPGVVAGQAAAHADDPTEAMPVVVGAPAGMTAGSPADDATVAMPVVPAAAPPSPEPMDVTAGAVALGGLFGGPPGPAPAPVRAPAVPRRGLVAAVTGLAVVGLVAGVVGFSGLPGGDDGGSDGVVPVAAAPTTSAPTDSVAPETASEDPLASETYYGGPSTSPAERTTTTVKSSTTTPRTTTSTKPSTTTTTTKPRTTPPTLPTTIPTEFTRYASCRAMNRDYPHGVGRPGARDRNQGSGGERVRNFYVSAPLYFINADLDTDGDGIACEA